MLLNFYFTTMLMIFEEINIQKKAYIERIGSECVAEDIPFFLEVLTYDDNIPDNKSLCVCKSKTT